jgi:molybdate transport system permease protein
MRAVLGLIVLAGLLIAPPLRAAEPRAVRVSAAISLATPVERIAAGFSVSAGNAVTVATASSGKLAAQIEAADVADVFVSADAASMERLVSAGRVDRASVRAIAGNRLVVIVPGDGNATPQTLGELSDPRVRRIAIGDPATVPAGAYAMQALRSAGLEASLRQRLVLAASARQVLDYATRGEVDAAIVYASDAAAAGPAVRTTHAIDPSLHDPVVYHAGIVVGGNEPAARAFVSALTDAPARAVFADLGFTMPDASEQPPSPAGGVASATEPRGLDPLLAAMGLSLRVAGTASLLAMAIAVPLAWVSARRRFAGKSVLEAVLLLPLVLPPTVIGYALIVLLGRHGLLGGWLEGSLLFRIEGAILAATVVALPLIYLPTRAAFASVDREMEDIARLMGASRAQTFWHVSLPMARRGIASGLMLGFARGLGEFGATVMVLGVQPGRLTLPISIYRDYERGTLAAALPAVLLLTAVSLAIVLLYNRSALGRGE